VLSEGQSSQKVVEEQLFLQGDSDVKEEVAHYGPPKLTQGEKDLLNANSGCYKILNECVCDVEGINW
jgi:hypothetical protein